MGGALLKLGKGEREHIDPLFFNSFSPIHPFFNSYSFDDPPFNKSQPNIDIFSEWSPFLATFHEIFNFLRKYLSKMCTNLYFVRAMMTSTRLNFSSSDTNVGKNVFWRPQFQAKNQFWTLLFKTWAAHTFPNICPLPPSANLGIHPLTQHYMPMLHWKFINLSLWINVSPFLQWKTMEKLTR